MSAATFTKTGNKATTAVKLPSNVFGLEVTNHQLLKDAYIAYLANSRQNNAKAKTRGDVSGGGKKPWRQKGTGRARFGSTRNPIWRKGGVAFGPTGLENYSRSMSVNAKRQAIKQALSLKAAADLVIVLEAFEYKDGKVANTIKLLNKMDLSKNILLVVTELDDMLRRATNNADMLKAVRADRLNVFDVLNADHIVVTTDSIAMIEDWLAPKVASKSGDKS